MEISKRIREFSGNMMWITNLEKKSDFTENWSHPKIWILQFCTQMSIFTVISNKLWNEWKNQREFTANFYVAWIKYLVNFAKQVGKKLNFTILAPKCLSPISQQSYSSIIFRMKIVLQKIQPYVEFIFLAPKQFWGHKQFFVDKIFVGIIAFIKFKFL